MRYSIRTTGQNQETSIILKDNQSGNYAEIFLFGALLNQFVVDSVNVIDGYQDAADAQKNITDAFQSAKLSPFPCRLANSRFAFEGKEYVIDKFKSGGSALHGLLFDAYFAIESQHVDDNGASVTLHFDYDKKEDGFPFPFSIQVQYSFAGNSLYVATHVKNNGPINMPLADGWHPYFKLGDSINEDEIRFRSEKMVVFDDTLLPTGEKVPYSAYEEFQLLGDTELDNSFVLDENNTSPALQLRNKNMGLQLSVYPEKSYPILQIYTPPNRKSIAIENLSSPPDAFNSKDLLLSLAPGQKHSFGVKYVLEKI